MFNFGLNGDRFRVALDAFHERHANQPKEIHKVKCMLHEIMSEIDKRFRSLKISQHVEYSGSCYEGIHVPKEDGGTELDFEAIVVIDNDAVELEAQAIAKHPGYASLKFRNGAIPRSETNVLSRYKFFGFLTADRFLDPTKMMDTFFEELLRCIERSEMLNKQVQLRCNGNAILLDVYPENGPPFWGPRFFTIQVIPAYEVSGELYVATTLPEESMPNSVAWRRLFALKEKELLLCITRKNQCSKQVLITLKAIRNHEPGLAQFTSYHLKMVFFWQMLGSSQSLSQGTLSQNVIAVLRLLHDKLAQRNLPHFLLPEKNLFDSMTDASILNLRYALNCLLTNESTMMRVLTVWQQGEPYLKVLKNFFGPAKKQLDRRVNDSKEMCLMYMSTIERRLLQQNFSCRFHSTGCLFQGIGVRESKEPTLDYEMLMIMNCHKEELKPYYLSNRPGQVYLEPQQGDKPSARLDRSLSYYTFFSALNSATFADPVKTAKNCFQEIKKCVNGSNVLKGKIYIRRNGRSIKVSIYPWSGRLLWGRHLCSIKLIPSYEVGNSIYVARSVDGGELPDWKAWRRSFLLEEEEIWSADREGECRKAVMCVLQLLCMKDAVLSQLTSYHLKMALFLTQTEPLDWSDEKLAERFMGVLERLHRCLKENNLPDHFLPNNNLLVDLNPSSVCELHQRIHLLCSDEKQMMTLLNS